MGEIILHGIRNPDLGRGSRVVLNGIPKLNTPPGLEKRQLNFGWGFRAVLGLCLKKFLYWMVAVLVVGLAFVPAWLASISSTDLQNALAPVTFLISLVTIALATVALLSAS